MFYRGQPVGDIHALLEQCCGLPADAAGRRAMAPTGFLVANPAGSVLRPGEERPLIVIDADPDRHALADAFLKAPRVISYQACYCSVFDVCWMSNLSGLQPHDVANCPMDGRDFNQDTE